MPVASSQQFPRSRRPEPVLITEAAAEHGRAARRPEEALRHHDGASARVCLVLAAVFYHVVWLMLIFAVLGTVLPWIAVVMANDGPPKKRVDPHRYTPPPADRELEAPKPARVIDG